MTKTVIWAMVLSSKGWLPPMKLNFMTKFIGPRECAALFIFMGEAFGNLKIGRGGLRLGIDRS